MSESKPRRRLSPEEQLERLQQKLKTVQDKMKSKQREVKNRETRERTKRLIELGGLCEIAELGQLDKGVLMGALLEIKLKLNDPGTSNRWKLAGDATLHEREQQRLERQRQAREIANNPTSIEKIDSHDS